MTRRRITLLLLPVLLILLLAGGFAWLLRSESGAQWLWQRLAAATPGQLQAQRSRGDLRSGLTLEDLSYRDAGLVLTADTITLRLGLDLWPPAVELQHLRIGELSVQTQPAPPDAAASSVGEWLPALALPVRVTFGRVEVARVTWAVGADEPRIDLRNLLLSGDWHRQLVLHDARLESGGSRWQAGLDLDLQAPHRLHFKATGSIALSAPSTGLDELSIRAQASGDLEKSQWLIEADDPQFRLSGELRNLLAVPDWNLRLTTGRLDWPPAPAQTTLSLHDLLIDSQGTLDNHALQAEARIDGAGLPALQARVVGTGDHTGVAVERLELAGETLQLDGKGRFDWSPALGARLDAAVARFDPQPWFAAWKGAAPASGRIAIAWRAGSFEFQVLEAVAPGTLEGLQASGRLAGGDGPAGIVNAELSWQGLAWPPGAAEPGVFSRAGQARVGGTPDAWTVAGDLELSGPDFPSGRLNVEGSGDRESMSLQIPRGEVLGGSLAGALNLRWSPEVSWSANAQLTDVATAPLASTLPGRLSGELAARGRTQPAQLEIDLRELKGTVRDRPVGARGQLVLEAGKIHARGLKVISGDSELTADGHMDTPKGLTVEARIASLADLVDGASGVFNGRATVSLNPRRPMLRLDGSGQGLTFGDTVIGQLALSTDPTGEAQTRLELRDVVLGGLRVDSMTVVTAGAQPLEQLDARVESSEGKVTLHLAGAMRDWRAPLARGWRGQLDSLRLERSVPGLVEKRVIELLEPAAVSLHTGGASLAQACFSASPAGRLCLESEWRTGAERTLSASFEDISPSFALNLLGSELGVTQQLSGVVDWRQRPGRPTEARVRLDVSAGEVTLDDDVPLFTTGAGLIGFEMADGRLHSGNLDIPLPGVGGIDTDFSVPDMSYGLDSPIQGRLRIDLDDIEPILRLLPPVEGNSGPVTVDLRFSGTLGEPRVSGTASLVDGRISHFASGMLLENLQLAGAVNETDQLELNGTFRAGEGQGALRTVVNFADLRQPELLLELRGEQLTLVNVPNLNVVANPDVRLTLRPETLDVSGRIVVPSARVSPNLLPTSNVVESADVVIVAGQDSQPAAPQQQAGQRKVLGQLELDLGEDVLLQIGEEGGPLQLEQAASAHVTGTTLFSWENGRPIPTGSGSFHLNGEITAYGQRLEVTKASVNFSNRPADNPFLNIRAEREIYGNTNVTRAGVLVTGTLKRPKLETYTVPMTTNERALTLLVTGSDFDYEQGTGSVQVGMYVAPKLYVSYGIGLFDEQYVISARYDLGKGLGIKTTSGQRETGADVTYTIEK